MADVFGAAQGEHIRWSGSISDEILSLSIILWEVLKDDPRLLLLGQRFDELGSYNFVLLTLKSILQNKLIEVNKSHISSSSHSLTNGRLTGAFWSENTDALGKDGSLGLSINVSNRSRGINFDDLAKLGVIVNDLRVLCLENINSSFDDFRAIVLSWAFFQLLLFLGPLYCSLDHELLRNVIVKNLVSFEDGLLEILSLINCSWEAID